MASENTVSSSWFLAILQQFEQHGIKERDLAPLLDNPGPPAAFRQVQEVMLRRIWHRAMALSGDPLLGLKVGAALPLQAMNILGLIIIQSPSLTEALAATVKYHRLVTGSSRVSLRSSPKTFELRYQISDAPVAVHPAQLDSIFMGYLTLLHRCAPHLRPLGVETIGTDKRLHSKYEDYFGCRVTLRVTLPKIIFSRQNANQPWPGADGSLFAALTTTADLALLNLSRSQTLVDSIAAYVTVAGFTKASCDGAARSIGLSRRTLQRRLAEAGTSFTEIAEAARMDEAMRLIATTQLPLYDVASRTGYADHSAFSFAVRKHFGSPPRQLRDRSSGKRGKLRSRD